MGEILKIRRLAYRSSVWFLNNFALRLLGNGVRITMR